MVAALRIGFILAALIGFPHDAHAAKPSPFLESYRDKNSVDTRLNFLERRLDDERNGAEWWQYGWLTFNGGAMVANAVLAGVENDKKDRSTQIVQSAEGLIGFLDLLLRPLPARYGADPVRDIPVKTEQDRLQRLALAEQMMRQGAKRAREPYQVMPQLALFGINIAAGAVIWQLADFQHAYLTVIPGIVFGEAQLLTTPGQPAEDLDTYQQQFGGGAEKTGWYITPHMGGIEIVYAF